MSDSTNLLLEQLKIETPVICGPMYPGSNPELVAAVSEAGGLGVVQPVTMTHVYGYDFREGLRRIKSLTNKPFGVNFTIMEGMKSYEERNTKWMHIAIEEGVKFFLTSLGNPKRVVKLAHQNDVIVYHDASTRAFADKAIASGVDGINCVNNYAGGHTGSISPFDLINDMKGVGVPLVCAGGVGNAEDMLRMLEAGYAGVQMGTRFLATKECQIPDSYKGALVKYQTEDIVHTNKISGTPSSVIGTPELMKGGLNVGPITSALLKGRKTKKLTRALLMLKASKRLKRAVENPGYGEIYQAGKGISNIQSIESAGDVVRTFSDALTSHG